MDIPRIYLFDYNNVALTIVFSVISSILAVEFSRQVKKQKEGKWRNEVVYSLLLALTFLLTHLFVVISVGIPFSTERYDIYFLSFFVICAVGSYVALHMSQKDIAGSLQYVLTSILIGISIIIADYIGFSVIFRDSIHIQPLMFILTSILTFSTSFSLLRFLMQVTNEDIYQFLKKWRYFGAAFAGLALAGIPYTMLSSMIAVPGGMGDHSFAVPFLFMATANLFFMLVPDLFGEKLIMKIVQSHLSLFSHNPDAVFRVDLKGYILAVNNEASELTGYTENELVGAHFMQLIGDNQKGMEIRDYFIKVLTGKTKMIETSMKKADHTYADVRITAVRIIVKRNTVGVFGIVRDITEKKKAEKMIEYLAYHDELTNLPNRRSLEKVMESTNEERASFSLIYLDFDRFKRINDTLGHSFGDKVLVQIGLKLSGAVPGNCLVSRLGGDEFAIIAPEGIDPEHLASEIAKEFQSPISVEGMELLITASMGIARFPLDTNNLERLLQYADMAMYRAKQSGENQFLFFTHSMVEQSMNKFQLENDLRNAISQGELSVYYQPKYNTGTNEITGAEALARWFHPKRGLIPPGFFIPMAEETNLIVPLERLIIKKVFLQMNHWMKKGLHVPRTSINISIVHFYQEDFVSFFKKELHAYNISGSLVEIEVTESIMIKKEDSINEQLQALREIGIEVSIDDFGTGYSSLSYLSKLSVDRLKIDQSFIAYSHDNREIISTIVTMAKNLKLEVIAEGVETESQILLLKSLGCNEVQGYFYSPPLPEAEYEAIIEAHRQFQPVDD